MSKVNDKQKMNVIMEAKGYVYVPWNDERNINKGPGYYVLNNPLPTIGVIEIAKLQHKSPTSTWDFIMSSAIEFGCKIDSMKHDTRDKAFDKLYRFCYNKLNKSPENQLDMFSKEQEKCACGKNPSCECKK